jgi:coenzyme F420-reducing hydrogenase beta subunit
MTAEKPEQNDSISNLVAGGYCIGCGVCAAVQNSPAKIVLNAYGKYEAKLDSEVKLHRTHEREKEQLLTAVCPFSDQSTNETDISRSLFSKDNHYHDLVGFWRDCYMGHVSEGSFRANGSSGGFVSWLLCELFERNEIDGVLHVLSASVDEQNPFFFRYGISKNVDEVKVGAKSRYYPVEMSGVLNYVRTHPGRYAVVGIPCFIKAIRLLGLQDSVFSERILFTISILCGHLKSTGYLEYIAWQMGVLRNEIEDFDFRHKLPTVSANQYIVRLIQDSKGPKRELVKKMKELHGGDWGFGLFKYSACEYCDDVMGETADVAVGDAWVEPYTADPKGTNVIVVRNKRIHDIIQAARESTRLRLDRVSPDAAAKTQISTFRHRHDGLAYRLWLKERSGQWAPRKRIQPSKTHISERYKRIFEIRLRVIDICDALYEECRLSGDFSAFWSRLNPLFKEYRKLYAPFWKRALNLLWRKFKNFVARIIRKPL